METERVSCVGASTTIPASNIIAANSIGSAGVSSCVRVAVRLRPLSAKELLDGGGAPVVDAQPSQNAVIVRAADPLQPHASGHPAAARIFLFDDVYAPSDSQEAVYTRSVKPLVDCFLSGFNATTLAYGQTGSGKTWTMGTGLEASSLPQELQGIVPRAIADIFSSLALKKQQPTFSFSVHVSFLELYNEDFIDLLNPRPRSAASSSSAASFAPTIREDAHGNIIWTNVREEPVSSPKELLSCLQRGSLCRSTGSTDMNASSSRSHAIFSIILKQNITEEFFTQNSASNIPDASRHADSPFLEPNPKQTTQKSLVSKFHFVDLAGSERLKRTNAEGDRKREGISINVGLLALGNVISALGDESRSSTTTHVPYRDSKLTRLLQDSLGGNSRTLMIACASPSESSFGETVSTLTYANRARNIKNKAIVNEEVGAGINAAAEREIRKLRTLVADLRDEIMSLRGGASLFGSGLNSRPSSVAGFNHTSESVSEAIAAHERDFQLHLQGERELAVQLEAAKTETQMARFTGDRFGFKCGRLMDRMNVLLEELNSVTTERDAAKIELAQWRSGKLRFCDSTRDNIKVSVASIDIKACEINSPSFELSAEMITNYNNTISELKFKLSETNDKLAWYNEVVTSFNSEESRREKILLNFNSLPGNIEEVPSPKMVRTLKTEGATSQEVSHQRKLWRALQDDPDVGQALSPTKSSKFAVPEPETVGKVRLFGLPKDTSNTFLPSHLINDTIDEEEEYEDIEDGNESEDAHSMYIDDVNISTVDDAGDEMDESKQLNQDKSVKSSTFSQEDRSSDIFMLIHRLQSDIAQHQALIDQQMKREQAYQAFKEAYESKLTVLQSQLNSVCHERDEAMKKMKTGAGSKEKPGTAAIKQRFDEQKRKLEAQIQEFKRKIAEKAKDNAQSRNEGLTKQLMQTIDSLKAEKFKALKELKKESTKIRDMKTSKEREIARLKKREKAATELAKKLERSNQLQASKLKSKLYNLKIIKKKKKKK
ncbi:Kinesin-like protein kif21b [Physocladia obscura]|uniref:Kinesin-like protein kif21b n=1 Tax=Physocladia obscura TaxID=109957 RepID=A0AAD5T8U9_9FUNG|nr:Kinesin-like protein kif21b [Physocladia obscura]